MKFNIKLYALFLVAPMIAVQTTFTSTAAQVEERTKRDKLREEEADARHDLILQAHKALVQLTLSRPQQLIVHGSDKHPVTIANTHNLHLTIHSGTVFVAPEGTTNIENNGGNVYLAVAPGAPGYQPVVINAAMFNGQGHLAAAPGSNPIINMRTEPKATIAEPSKIEEIE